MTTPSNTTPVKLAFILDNEVVDIIHTDERLSSIFLSQPKIINITNLLNENPGFIMVGTKYDPNIDKFEFPEPAIVSE